MIATLNVKADTRLLESLRRGSRPALQQALTEAAERVAADARQRAPVDTGALRHSIQVAPESGQLQLRVEATVDYAAYVEMGTARMAAQPYLRPAMLAEKPRLEAAVKRVINRRRR